MTRFSTSDVVNSTLHSTKQKVYLIKFVYIAVDRFAIYMETSIYGPNTVEPATNRLNQLHPKAVEYAKPVPSLRPQHTMDSACQSRQYQSAYWPVRFEAS